MGRSQPHGTLARMPFVPSCRTGHATNHSRHRSSRARHRSTAASFAPRTRRDVFTLGAGARSRSRVNARRKNSPSDRALVRFVLVGVACCRRASPCRHGDRHAVAAALPELPLSPESQRHLDTRTGLSGRCRHPSLPALRQCMDRRREGRRRTMTLPSSLQPGIHRGHRRPSATVDGFSRAGTAAASAPRLPRRVPPHRPG